MKIHKGNAESMETYCGIYLGEPKTTNDKLVTCRECKRRIKWINKLTKISIKAGYCGGINTHFLAWKHAYEKGISPKKAFKECLTRFFD